MIRRKKKGILAAIAATLMISAPDPAAALEEKEPFADVKITSEQLSDTLYMLKGAGGNIGVSVGEDGVFIIDDQFAPLTDRILKAVRALSDQPVRFVINTHWHFDHTGGNENMAGAGAVVIAHDNVRKRMKTGAFMKAFDREIKPAPNGALPVVTFSKNISLHLNGEEARVVHIESAHTDGDAIVWFKDSNVMHMGDTFFYKMYPFIDLQSGGSVDGVIKNAEHVLTHIDDATKIIPGHGPQTDKAGLQAYVDMLVAVSGKVAQMKADGMSKDEVLAANPTSVYDANWHTGDAWRDRFVSILYEDSK